MNNKVSKYQIGMLLSLIMCGLYLGINDVILLRKSGNEVLLSMLIGTIIGLIPICMYLKINNTLPYLNIYEKNTKLFGKVIGNIFNVLLFIFYLFLLVLSLRALVIFINSKYLQNTSFIVLEILVTLTSFLICYKGLETIFRVSQISFIATIIFMIIIESFLFKFVEISNILPLLDKSNYISNIIDGCLFHASTTSLLSILLLTIEKNKIVSNKNYNKIIISFYLFGNLTLILVMFFTISCLGYKLSSIFRYPEYVLLKKIAVSNTELHLENLLAFRWIIYILSLIYLSMHSIKVAFKAFINKEKNRNRVTFIFIIIAIILGRIIFKDAVFSIRLLENYYVYIIAIPIFILITIIFIRCLIYKRR